VAKAEHDVFLFLNYIRICWCRLI